MSSFRNLFLATFLLAVSSIGGSAQKMRLDYKVEANIIAGGGEYTPFYLMNNPIQDICGQLS